MWHISAYGIAIGVGNTVINNGVNTTEPWILRITNSAYIPNRG